MNACHWLPRTRVTTGGYWLLLAALCFPRLSQGLTADTEASAAPAESVTPADAWPMFRGNSWGTGVSAAVTTNKLELLWRHETPNGAYEGSPAIVQGVVFAGDLDGNLLALDLETGKVRWQVQFPSGFPSSPSVRNGRLYIGDYDGRLRCIDTQDGTERWNFQAGAEINSGVNFVGDRILFGSQDATLYCLSAADGQLAWKLQVQDQIRCSPTVVEGRAFVAGCDGVLHIIDVEQGKELAGVPIQAPTGVTPAVLGSAVYFGTEAGEMFGVDWRAAKVLWTIADSKGGQPIRSCPAVWQQRVIYGSRSRKVRALDAQTGQLVWEFTTKHAVDSSPTIAGQMVYVGSADGRVYGLKWEDGKQVWEYETGAGIVGSPAIVQGQLVVANERGTIYCFGEGSGAPR